MTPEEIPPRLIHQLFELDADYAEALWALDQPANRLNWDAMERDTLAALGKLTAASARFRKHLPIRVHATLAHLEAKQRNQLNPAEAYNMVPGHDPRNR